jgi:hypothetical protein
MIAKSFISLYNIKWRFSAADYKKENTYVT